MASSPQHLPFAARSIGLPSNGVSDQGWKLYITSLIMVICAGLFVIARIATRLASKQIGSDDYTIVASLIFSIWLSVMIQLAVVHGYGKHIDDLTGKQAETALMFFWIAQTPYKVVVSLNKISVVLFSKRIFTMKNFQIACWVALFILIGWGLGGLGATVFQCIPAEGSWNPNVDATCIDKDAFWIAFATGNAITDAMVLILPLPMVFKLQLKLREKILLSGVFLLGGFVLVCSIMRTTAVSDSLHNQRDITYNFIPRGIWTLIEANMGIICACLPMMKQTLRKVFPRLFTSTAHDDYYSFGTFPNTIDRPRDVYALDNVSATRNESTASATDRSRTWQSDEKSFQGIG